MSDKPHAFHGLGSTGGPVRGNHGVTGVGARLQPGAAAAAGASANAAPTVASVAAVRAATDKRRSIGTYPGIGSKRQANAKQFANLKLDMAAAAAAAAAATNAGSTTPVGAASASKGARVAAPKRSTAPSGLNLTGVATGAGAAAGAGAGGTDRSVGRPPRVGSAASSPMLRRTPSPRTSGNNSPSPLPAGAASPSKQRNSPRYVAVPAFPNMGTRASPNPQSGPPASPGGGSTASGARTPVMGRRAASTSSLGLAVVATGVSVAAGSVPAHVHGTAHGAADCRECAYAHERHSPTADIASEPVSADATTQGGKPRAFERVMRSPQSAGAKAKLRGPASLAPLQQPAGKQMAWREAAMEGGGSGSIGGTLGGAAGMSDGEEEELNAVGIGSPLDAAAANSATVVVTRTTATGVRDHRVGSDADMRQLCSSRIPGTASVNSLESNSPPTAVATPHSHTPHHHAFGTPTGGAANAPNTPLHPPALPVGHTASTALGSLVIPTAVQDKALRASASAVAVGARVPVPGGSRATGATAAAGNQQQRATTSATSAFTPTTNAGGASAGAATGAGPLLSMIGSSGASAVAGGSKLQPIAGAQHGHATVPAVGVASGTLPPIFATGSSARYSSVASSGGGGGGGGGAGAAAGGATTPTHKHSLSSSALPPPSALLALAGASGPSTPNPVHGSNSSTGHAHAGRGHAAIEPATPPTTDVAGGQDSARSADDGEVREIEAKIRGQDVAIAEASRRLDAMRKHHVPHPNPHPHHAHAHQQHSHAHAHAHPYPTAHGGGGGLLAHGVHARRTPDVDTAVAEMTALEQGLFPLSTPTPAMGVGGVGGSPYIAPSPDVEEELAAVNARRSMASGGLLSGGGGGGGGGANDAAFRSPGFGARGSAPLTRDPKFRAYDTPEPAAAASASALASGSAAPTVKRLPPDQSGVYVTPHGATARRDADVARRLIAADDEDDDDGEYSTDNFDTDYATGPAAPAPGTTTLSQLAAAAGVTPLALPTVTGLAGLPRASAAAPAPAAASSLPASSPQRLEFIAKPPSSKMPALDLHHNSADPQVVAAQIAAAAAPRPGSSGSRQTAVLSPRSDGAGNGADAHHHSSAFQPYSSRSTTSSNNSARSARIYTSNNNTSTSGNSSEQHSWRDARDLVAGGGGLTAHALTAHSLLRAQSQSQSASTSSLPPSARDPLASSSLLSSSSSLGGATGLPTAAVVTLAAVPASHGHQQASAPGTSGAVLRTPTRGMSHSHSASQSSLASSPHTPSAHGGAGGGSGAASSTDQSSSSQALSPSASVSDLQSAPATPTHAVAAKPTLLLSGAPVPSA